MKRTRRELVIYCDFCTANGVYFDGKYADHVKAAQKDGWRVHLDGRDICPNCVKSGKYKEQE